jgi:hypothetical protein
VNERLYANGDVSACEIHQPLGNLRKKSFWQIWHSEEARRLRDSIARKDCYFTTEVFMWPSIVFQPTRLAHAMVGAKVWQKLKPLPADQKVNMSIESSTAKTMVTDDWLVKLEKPTGS